MTYLSKPAPRGWNKRERNADFVSLSWFSLFDLLLWLSPLLVPDQERTNIPVKYLTFAQRCELEWCNHFCYFCPGRKKKTKIFLILWINRCISDRLSRTTIGHHAEFSAICEHLAPKVGVAALMGDIVICESGWFQKAAGQDLGCLVPSTRVQESVRHSSPFVDAAREAALPIHGRLPRRVSAASRAASTRAMRPKRKQKSLSNR